MKILLIAPARYRPDGSVNRTRYGLMPAVTLARLAALAPADAEVSICPDMLREPDYSSKPDIVGITGYTKSIARAYDIADAFRRAGAYVVMGGIHVSMEPEEALAHADTVFVGEAEETWPKFLADFAAGRAEKIYKGTPRPSMNGWPVPRFELLPRDSYYSTRRSGLLASILPLPFYPIETSRGCPHACAFCPTSPFLGTEYRVRPVEEVVAEIKALGARGVFFVDNNLFGDIPRAKRLLRAIKPLNISWAGQATLDSAEDGELLELAYASGCRSITVGLEAIDEERLSQYNKSFNRTALYRRQLKAFADHGISVLASMVFMPGCGDRAQFRSAYEFLDSCGVPYTAWWAMTPLPGTATYRGMKEAGRLKRDKWWLHKPGKYPDYKVTGPDLSEEEFFGGFMRYYRKFYSLPSLLRRLPSHWRRGWWAELVWNAGLMAVAHLRRDALNLYSPLGHDLGLLSFLKWRFFGPGRRGA